MNINDLYHKVMSLLNQNSDPFFLILSFCYCYFNISLLAPTNIHFVKSSMNFNKNDKCWMSSSNHLFWISFNLCIIIPPYTLREDNYISKINYNIKFKSTSISQKLSCHWLFLFSLRQHIFHCFGDCNEVSHI